MFTKLIGFLILSSSAFAFGPKPAEFPLNFSENMPSSLQEEVQSSIDYAFKISGENPTKLHQNIFGDISGNSYQVFFYNRINLIGFSGCGNSDGTTIACQRDPGQLWVTKKFKDDEDPLAFKISTLFHEARHAEKENNNWLHVKCPLERKTDSTGRSYGSYTLGGDYACDTESVGAYGTEVVMMGNLKNKCTNCTDKFKLDAELTSINMLDRIINEKSRLELIRDVF